MKINKMNRLKCPSCGNSRSVYMEFLYLYTHEGLIYRCVCQVCAYRSKGKETEAEAHALWLPKNEEN